MEFLRMMLSLCMVVTLAVSCSPWDVLAAPITIDFNTCRPSQYQTSPDPTAPLLTLQCCPPLPTKPIINGLPPPSTPFLRVRKASQCTDANYAAKLKRGYELMRALPDDDPRSHTQQWHLHCSYCGGAFVSASAGGNVTGIDIHFSWLFFPWHRYFMYFHERILQSLLGDPTFSLNYWNWDSPYTVGISGNGIGPCLKAGQDFPAPLYGDPSASTYDVNRSESAKGNGRLRFPDLTYAPLIPAEAQPLYNASAQDLVASNMNVMYQAMVSGGTTTETFLGRPYRAGDLQGNPSPTGGAGTLEASAHAGVHFWTGLDATLGGNDMGDLAFSARDPVFFAHHSNIDRLWEVWKSLGPFLGQNRVDYSDPDFLNAEFLFYDEKKTLRRVKVGDSLDTKNLGYVYQTTNDAAWIFANHTRCSSETYTQLLADAATVPVPTKDSNGYYHLVAGTPFIIVIDRPANPSGNEEFLTISGIKLDRLINAGFTVYVNLVYPEKYLYPTKCAEYCGRFVNMAMGENTVNNNQQFEWKESITKTLGNINAQPAPSKLVITLVPLTPLGGYERIAFSSVTVSN